MFFPELSKILECPTVRGFQPSPPQWGFFNPHPPDWPMYCNAVLLYSAFHSPTVGLTGTSSNQWFGYIWSHNEGTVAHCFGQIQNCWSSSGFQKSILKLWPYTFGFLASPWVARNRNLNQVMPQAGIAVLVHLPHMSQANLSHQQQPALNQWLPHQQSLTALELSCCWFQTSHSPAAWA